MSIEHPRNSFRASLNGGGEAPPALVVTEKKGASKDASGGLTVSRTEVRRSNSRDSDRHRLSSAGAVVRKGRRTYPVQLINISGNGAMIEGDIAAKLWQTVTLSLGEVGEVECAVRWIRGDRYGLEFAHETKIDCDPETLNETLRNVLSESDLPDEANETEPVAAASASDPRRRATRHPLIWSGLVRLNNETVVARIRNISATGAQIEAVGDFPVGSGVALDLGNAGSVMAAVCWSHGIHAGLSFRHRFDVRRLALVRPAVAPRNWVKPDYLEDSDTETSPWAAEWGRLTVKELKHTLGR